MGTPMMCIDNYVSNTTSSYRLGESLVFSKFLYEILHYLFKQVMAFVGQKSFFSKMATGGNPCQLCCCYHAVTTVTFYY